VDFRPQLLDAEQHLLDHFNLVFVKHAFSQLDNQVGGTKTLAGSP
jgi:hypothetical protein